MIYTVDDTTAFVSSEYMETAWCRDSRLPGVLQTGDLHLRSLEEGPKGSM